MSLAIICGRKTIAVFEDKERAGKFLSSIAPGCNAQLKKIPAQRVRLRRTGISATKKRSGYAPFMRTGHFTL